MDVSKSIYPALPRWVAVMYAVLAVVTIPWAIYLAVSLPTKHLSTHWDISWVGLDTAIVFLLILNAVYSYLESKWLVMSATATSTLLLVDGWFDVMSSHPGKQLIQALAMALLVELPLAILTFRVALRLVRREHLN
jgi:hypothetical protein